MRAVCVGGVVAGGRERRERVVAQRDQSVIKKHKEEVFGKLCGMISQCFLAI